MKKKIIASLLGMVMLVYLSLTKVVAFATATEGDLSGVNADTPAININYSTAAQTDAVEDTTDVDSDIREDIEDAIPDEWEEKKISTVDDFLKFAKDCNLDIWSDNKKIILENDISLVGTDFSGISTFGGYFDGQGHTISELSLNGEMSYAGLFSKLQKNAVVKDLNVTGTIMPSGSPIHVGGICADNSGTIMTIISWA